MEKCQKTDPESEIKFANVFAEVVAPVVSRLCFKVMLRMKKLKTIDRNYFLKLFI